MKLNTLLKHTSRSLYLSVKILPKTIRPAFGVAYLLCRYADTIADTALLPAEQRVYWIQQFPLIVRAQDTTRQTELTTALSGTSENPYETALINHLADCLKALAKLPQAQQLFIYEVVQAVCDGMKIDLMAFPHTPAAAPQAFLLDTDLTHYCRLMGGKPGLFWSQLIYHTVRINCPQNTFYSLGQQVGDALQMVNILRDLPRDIRQGRCYFPLTDLEQYTLKPADLRREEKSVAFKPIEKKWIRWGKQNLVQAIPYYRALPKTAWRIRAAVAWPMLWTADTFAKLAQTPDLLNSQKRVKIPRSRIYVTLLLSPFILASNALFEKWLHKKLKTLP